MSPLDSAPWVARVWGATCLGRLALLAPVLLLGAGPLAGSLPKSTSSKLKNWKVVSRPMSGSGARALGLVPTPSRPVLEVLNDVKAYPGLFPSVTSAKRIEKDLYRLTARFPWPMGEGWLVARLRRWRKGRTHVLRWTMVRGSLERYSTTVRIEPWSAHRCLISVEMLAVPRGAFVKMFMRWGVRRAAEQMVHAVRQRVTEKSRSR